MLSINIQFQGLDRVQKQLNALTGDQARGAYAKAINDTAFQEIRPAMQREMKTRFDRVTPFIERSPRVFPATADQLNATIAPTYRSDKGTKGGKMGVDPQQVLLAQEFGGRRRDKRSEVALRRAGILPAGYQTAIPATPFPGSEDGYGNLNGPFIAQLISYFQAFGEQGYRANMKDRTKQNLKRGGTAAKLAKVAGPQLGRRYIVSYGKLRGGARTTRKGEQDARASTLAPGIWAVMGNTDAHIRPVLMFVRGGSYRPRLNLKDIATSPETTDYLARRLRFRIREAAGV